MLQCEVFVLPMLSTFGSAVIYLQVLSVVSQRLIIQNQQEFPVSLSFC